MNTILPCMLIFSIALENFFFTFNRVLPPYFNSGLSLVYKPSKILNQKYLVWLTLLVSLWRILTLSIFLSSLILTPVTPMLVVVRRLQSLYSVSLLSYTSGTWSLCPFFHNLHLKNHSFVYSLSQKPRINSLITPGFRARWKPFFSSHPISILL